MPNIVDFIPKTWACGKKYRDYQGKYPVIFITFKDIKRDTWEETYDQISKTLRQEFERHSEILESENCSKYEKVYVKDVLEERADSTDKMMSLQRLSQMLDEHYGIPPIIIIDEYDTPIRQEHVRGFYDQAALFMRNLFSGGLKDNRHLSYGFLTGILRVAKESIFSGLNNLKVNSILDNQYSEYFGFTQEEVKTITSYYKVEEKYGEICVWYDGYRFGESEIFNPWSVVNYFSNGCQAGAYWQSTGSNEIIGEILACADEDIYGRLNMLLRGETVLTYIDTGVIYPQIRSNPSSVYSFLLVAGYLKAVKADRTFGGDYMCEVALPNREIAFVYNKEILQKLAYMIPQSTAVSIHEALYSNDGKKLQKEIHKLLLRSASCYDTAGENFYHGFVLGICALMDDRYHISSNGESEDGRYDIQLLPKTGNLPGILIELKAAKNVSGEKLRQLSEAALAQIGDRRYDTGMAAKGIKTIFKYGVAFSGKQVEIATEFL
ncbi:MAG: AAA family ATPase [Lachnospiraceae bacterium]|nr:AAA family ATPase [Lachnospiraceae bacterium]